MIGKKLFYTRKHTLKHMSFDCAIFSKHVDVEPLFWDKLNLAVKSVDSKLGFRRLCQQNTRNENHLKKAEFSDYVKCLIYANFKLAIVAPYSFTTSNKSYYLGRGDLFKKVGQKIEADFLHICISEDYGWSYDFYSISGEHYRFTADLTSYPEVDVAEHRGNIAQVAKAFDVKETILQKFHTPDEIKISEESPANPDEAYDFMESLGFDIFSNTEPIICAIGV